MLSLYESIGDSDTVIAHVRMPISLSDVIALIFICLQSQVVGRATSRTGAPFHQEYMMIVHIREEYPTSLPSGTPPSVRLDDSSPLNISAARAALKVYRAYEFVDTHFCAKFFPEERERARSQRRQQPQNQEVTTIQQPRFPEGSIMMPQSNAGAGDGMRLAKL